MLEDFGIQKGKFGSDNKDEGYLMQEGVLVKVGRILVFLAGVLTLIALWVHQEFAAEGLSLAMSKTSLMKTAEQAYQTNKIAHLSEKHAHAKLIRVLAHLQDHLEREMRTDYILRVSQSRLQDANAEHSKAIDRVAEVLEARSADTTYDMVGLRKDTLDSSHIYHSTAAAILQNVADSVVSDHKLAEDKLGKLTGGIMAELEADQQLEQQDAEEDAAIQKQHPDWETHFKRDHELAGAKTRDEKDVDTLITDFKKRLLAYPTVALPESAVKAANAAMLGLIGGAPYNKVVNDMKALVAKWEKTVDGFSWDMVSHGDGNDGVPTNDYPGQFRRVIDAAYAHDAKKDVLPTIAKFERGELTATTAIIEIERVIKSGKLGTMSLVSATSDPQAAAAVKHHIEQHTKLESAAAAHEAAMLAGV